tara:strand:+ start:1171 stop:1350 length:180 start_codon:yes stop_codon:yes gene_type:complete
MKAKMATKKYHALNAHLAARIKLTHVLALMCKTVFTNAITAILKVLSKIVTIGVVKAKS